MKKKEEKKSKVQQVTVQNTKIMHMRDGKLGVTDYIYTGSDDCVAWFDDPEEVIIFVNEELAEGITRYIYVEDIDCMLMGFAMQCVEDEDPFPGYGFEYIIKQNGYGVGFNVTKGANVVLEFRSIKTMIPKIECCESIIPELIKLIDFFEGKMKSSISATAWDALIKDLTTPNESGKRISPRTLFPDLRYKLCDTDFENIEEFCRHAYRGGFVMKPEDPGVTIENVTAYDINSSYGYQMKEAMLPIMKAPTSYGRNQSLYYKELPDTVLSEEGVKEFNSCELDEIKKMYEKMFGNIFKKSNYTQEEEDKLYHMLYRKDPERDEQEREIRHAKRMGIKVYRGISGDHLFNDSYYTILRINIYRATLKEGGVDWAINDMEDSILTGEGPMTLTQDDFYNVIENYDIVFSITGCVYFLTGKGMYSNYINYFEARKEAAKDKVERSFAKAMINNISGRLAAKGKYNNIKFEKISLNTGGTEIGVNYKQNEKKFLYAHIGAGCAITSKARRFLIQSIKKQNGKVVYCDTDSMHIAGAKAVGIELDNKKLGCWKEEHTFSKVKYYEKKWYIGIEEGESVIKMSGEDDFQRNKLLKYIEENGFEALTKDKLNMVLYS